MPGVVGGDGDVDPLAAVVQGVLQTLGERQREYPGGGRAPGVPRAPGEGGGGDGGLRHGGREQRHQGDQPHQLQREPPDLHHHDTRMIIITLMSLITPMSLGVSSLAPEYSHCDAN